MYQIFIEFYFKETWNVCKLSFQRNLKFSRNTSTKLSQLLVSSNLKQPQNIILKRSEISTRCYFIETRDELGIPKNIISILFPFAAKFYRVAESRTVCTSKGRSRCSCEACDLTCCDRPPLLILIEIQLAKVHRRHNLSFLSLVSRTLTIQH